MNKFVIAGAGGFGREVYSYILNAFASDAVRGFLDDNPDALCEYGFKHKIISDFAGYKPLESDIVVFAVANPKIKKSIAEILKSRGAKFGSFIHPSAVLGLNVKISEGAVVAPFCVIGSNAEIGSFASINTSVNISSGAKIGAYSTVSSQCSVGENAILEEGAFMASSSILESGLNMFENSTLGINSYADKNVEKSRCAFGNPAEYL